MTQRADEFFAKLSAVLSLVPEEQTQPPPEGRVGAVLVLIEDSEEGPRFVLTRRRRDLRSHPGQLSFPGGRRDEGESITAAAVREAREEIGLRPDSIELLGMGPTFFIPPSKFWVVPVVARWVAPHEVDPSPWEVDEVIHVPISMLLRRELWRHVPLSLRGSSWAWQLDDDLLWGATAMLIALLLDHVMPGWSQGVAPIDLGDDLSVKPWEDIPSIIRRVRLEGDLPAIEQSRVPHVTVAQMRAVDEGLFSLGIGLAQLAEQAGRGVAHAVRRLVMGDVEGTTVTVLAGGGGNGAGGLIAARLLAAAGADVEVLLTATPGLEHQTRVLASAGVSVRVFDGAGSPGEVVVDAMLGIGVTPPVRDLVKDAIEWLRRHDALVVSLDLPSGIDGDAGLHGPCVTADVTVTVGAPKTGLLSPVCHPYVGDLYVADLGVPRGVWESVGVAGPDIFARGPLVRLTDEAVSSDAATPDQTA